MITEFSLENFRVFRDKTTFKIKPITILTGPNNSGKSSVNLLLRIVSGFFRKIEIGNKSATFSNLNPTINSLPLEDLVLNYFKDTYLPSVILSDDQESCFKVSYRIQSNVIKEEFLVNCDFKFKKKNNILLIELQNLIIKATGSGVNHFQYVAHDPRKDGNSSFSFTSLNLKNLIECHKDISNSSSLSGSINEFNLTDSFDELNNDPKKWLKKIKSSRNNDYQEKVSKTLKAAFPKKFTEEGLNSILNNFDKLKDFAFTEDENEIKEKYRLLKNDYYFRHIIQSAPPELIEDKTDTGFSMSEYGFYEKAKACAEELFNNEETIMQALELYDDCLKQGFLLENIVSKETLSVLNMKSIPLIPFKRSETPNFDIKFYDSLNKNNISSMLSNILIGNDCYANSGFGSASLKVTELVLYDLFKSIYEFSSSIVTLNPYTIPKQNNFPVLQNGFASNLLLWYANPSNSQLLSTLTHKNILKEFNVCDDFSIQVSNSGDQVIPVLVKNGKKFMMSDVGVGSYNLFFLILSYLQNLDDSLGSQKTFIIEEPEANLHPKIQSKLAELFTQMSDLGFFSIIETHSEYLIRKLQYLVAKGECNPDDVVIYYIADPDPAQHTPGTPQVREITLDKKGRMSHDFGPGFFDEADNLAIQLFNHNQNNN